MIILPSGCQLVMDSLPQEIVDEIINNLPRSSLRFSSLVARRWRKRNQQRALSTIHFYTESMVSSWHTDIQIDPAGVSSCVQSAGFKRIDGWDDPTLFIRVLKNFNSLTALGIYETEISDELLEQISRGELGQSIAITALCLHGLRCSLSALIPIILAFPTLRELTVVDFEIMPREAPLTYPALSPRRPLDSLVVRGLANREVAETLANHQFASRSLTLDAQPRNIQKLLTLSSATIVELVLKGTYPLCVDRKSY